MVSRREKVAWGSPSCPNVRQIAVVRAIGNLPDRWGAAAPDGYTSGLGDLA